ncbi:MAG: hypothetical protein O7G85_11575, partial [Planctomycetota bacterium]|nr:hypothetical protein [Planctomycetota bacterium]
EMEFNPLRSLVDHSANKKHVIVLSADPNAILDQIAAFAEEAETTKALVSAFKASITSLTRDDLTNLKFDTPIRRSIATELDLLSKSEDVDSLEKLLAILNEAKSNVENLK